MNSLQASVFCTLLFFQYMYIYWIKKNPEHPFVSANTFLSFLNARCVWIMHLLSPLMTDTGHFSSFVIIKHATMNILAYLGELSIGKVVALRDFTGGPVGEDPPASIRGRASFPGLGRVHMPRGN